MCKGKKTVSLVSYHKCTVQQYILNVFQFSWIKPNSCLKYISHHIRFCSEMWFSVQYSSIQLFCLIYDMV